MAPTKETKTEATPDPYVERKAALNDRREELKAELEDMTVHRDVLAAELLKVRQELAHLESEHLASGK